MLPTEKASDLLLDAFGRLHESKYYGKPWESIAGEDKHQFLHVISIDKEEWNPGDSIYTTNVPVETIKGIDKEYSTQPGYEWLITVEGNGNQYKPCEIHGKIVASSDPSLGLPRLSEDFIKAYVNKQGQIAEVMIEYEKHMDADPRWQPTYQNPDDPPVVTWYAVKLRDDNTVIVSPARTFTEDKVRKALHDGIDFGISKMGVVTNSQENDFIQKWLDQNG